jgi:putative ABC transport system permease protein
MIKNYLKIAFRNLLKRKVFSTINVLGLAIGMAVCLLIILFIQSELGYDTYHKNADQIYRMVLERKYPGRSTSYAIIPQSIGDAVKAEFPEVLESTKMFDFTNNGTFPFNVGDKVYEETNVYAVDPSFFKVFTYETLAGDPIGALKKPHNIVINQSTAEKLFGSAGNALGKSVLIEEGRGKVASVIAAVVKNWPLNTHFHFNMLLSTVTFPPLMQPGYTGFSTYTYLLLRKNASAAALEQKFPLIIQKYVSGAIAKSFGETFEQFQAAGNGYHYYLQPLKKIHLISALEAELSPNGSMASIYIFAVIAVFILFLACINFINLSTSLSVERAKEVGIRKTFGSEKKSIIYQFLFESIIISLFSLIISVILVAVFIPLFNAVSGKNLSVLYYFSPVNLGALILFSLIVGVVSGIYPAFILSSFNPVTVLKGRFKSNKKSLILRNGLVIFQFAISIILIIATITVNKQITFMLGDQLGFKK